LTDAVVKQVQAGLISREEGLRKLGYSPQEIERMAGEQRQAADTSGTAQLLNLLDTGTPTTGAQPAPAGA
jgi:capsid protein